MQTAIRADELTKSFGVVKALIGLDLEVTTGSAAIGAADLDFATLLAARLSVVAAGILVLGVGTLAHGLIPRHATTSRTALWCGHSWPNSWAPAPGQPLAARPVRAVSHHPGACRRPPLGHGRVLVGIGIAAVTAGALAFVRRDLTSA